MNRTTLQRQIGRGLKQILAKSLRPSPLGLRLLYRLLKLNHKFKRWVTKHLTPAGIGVLCALFIFGLIGLDVKRSVSYQIFVFLLALLIVSIILAHCTRYQISAKRLLPRFGTVDTPLRYRVVIHSRHEKQQIGLTLRESFKGTFPSFSDFRTLMRTKGGKASWLKLVVRHRWAFSPAIKTPPLSQDSATEVAAELIPLRRGVLPLNKLTLACPDPLGLVNRCVTLALPQKVLILPKRYQLPAIHLPGSRQYQSDGLAMAASVGSSEEFRALREYRPGDSPRKIHWKSWAKTGKPIIKEEQTEHSVRHALILDTFQAEAYSEIMEAAIAIAASFAYPLQTHGQTQESLLNMLFMGNQSHNLTVGHSQTEQLLTLLASASPCQDQPFEALLPIVRSHLSLLSGCICIFLTWDSDRKALIEQLQAANIPTLGLIITSETGLEEPIDRSCLKNSRSSLNVLHLNRIQEDLLSL